MRLWEGEAAGLAPSTDSSRHSNEGGANDWVSSDAAREINAQDDTITTFRVTA
ncbi:hypothetical protein ACFQY4_13845 [Catellatospora bangladeshensis]|uniref:Uncharacterized protein n=1 Tax=Catellatospora bangladeshensis TaxID=310355 RepID=A0A8J3NM76_9ACTN|nr:hypothetical protein [Catellatospora bangladeshensis]GIF84911.1 hypothetical protein Cba03nite_62600 [Catellatospora bangladeshensis]